MPQPNNEYPRISDTWLRSAYNVIDKIEDLGVTVYGKVLQRFSSNPDEETSFPMRSQTDFRTSSF